jgi:hypothetical protein
MTQAARALGGRHPAAWPRALLIDGTWLTPDRARAWGRVVCLGGLVLTAGLTGLYAAAAATDPHGLAYSCDFNAFWSAAHLAVTGHPGLAYDPAAMTALEYSNAQRPPHGGFLPFLYSPVFLLLCLPLGALPYAAALLLFTAANLAAFTAAILAILPRSWPRLAVAAFPGALVNLVSTQNGGLSAALFGGAMTLLDRRPALAGALLGGFAFKPQLALCLPVALICARRFRAVAGCAASAIALCLLSWIVLGGTAWQGFAGALPFTRAIMLHAANVWGTSNSVYAALRILGAGAAPAMAAQALSAILAASVLARLCWRRPGGQAEIAASIAAALLMTPYVMDYDLISLGVPMAWFAARSATSGWRAWEKSLLALLYVYPWMARIVCLKGVPVTPLLCAALLLLIARRARATP